MPLASRVWLGLRLQIKDELKTITSVKQLKKYTIGQGIGWVDSNILRANGFQVIEIPNYSGLFKMTAAGRIDLFCRGINELKGEYEAFKYIKELTYDESFVLIYPMPRFYYTNKSNTLLRSRVEDGLKISYLDGSLKKLWLKYQTANLEFVKLHQRKVFRLPNPLLEKLPKTYESYYFDITKH
jgi:ABC-type amino acid transport substrate-binding protein